MTNRPPRKYTNPSTFRLGEDLAAAMERLQIRDGIPPSEQVRRALAAWLEKRGVLDPPNADRPKRTRSVNVDGNPAPRPSRKRVQR
jgi:hypothetical protein